MSKETTKKSFSIFGSKYVVYFDAFEFCGVYYGEHDCEEEYILDCLKAEMSEFTPSSVIYTVELTHNPDTTPVTHIYLDPNTATYLDLWTACLDIVEPHLTTEDKLSTADKWVNILKQNLLEVYDITE